MPKKIINDIVISKKSIRQIPIAERKTPPREVRRRVVSDEEEIMESPVVRHAPNWQRRPLNPKFVLWLIAIICVLALFFGVSLLFSSATVVVTPKTAKVNFNNDLYVAKSDSSVNATGLFFEVLTVKQTASEVVAATAEKEVSQKASGQIVIYNNYSTAPQRLINNTRFEANNGKVYRIGNSVVVPGLKKVNGKNVPGSVEATVYADQAGESYNLKMADLVGDFKIPGFKGDVRYQSFYALLKTDITGGYVGLKRIVADDLRQETEEIIRARLKEQLVKELYAVKPDDYLIFKDSYSIDYVTLVDTAVENDKVKINLDGNLSAIVFNNAKLAKYIAVNKLPGFDNLPVELILTDGLVTAFKAENLANLSKNKILELRLSGEATIKWQYDSDAMKKDLAGKKEADLSAVLAKYQSSIVSVQVIFKPVWTRYFPDDLNKITIQEEI